MRRHLDSKTMFGLLVLLLAIVGLAVAHALTDQAIEGIKWVGTTFMGVRTAANICENLPSRGGKDASDA